MAEFKIKIRFQNLATVECSVNKRLAANRVGFYCNIIYIHSRYLAHLTKICSNKEFADELSTQLIQIKKPSSEKQSRLTLSQAKLSTSHGIPAGPVNEGVPIVKLKTSHMPRTR